MAVLRTCDFCGHARQAFVGLKPVDGVQRYGLSLNIPHPSGGKRTDGRAKRTIVSMGGVDICNDCLSAKMGRGRVRRVACDRCGFQRPTLYRLALRQQRKHGVAALRVGGVSLCHECWDRIAKRRPALRGKTGPAEWRGRVAGQKAIA